MFLFFQLFKILEFVRDGEKTVAELMDIGKQLLGRYNCEFYVSFVFILFFCFPNVICARHRFNSL